MNGVPTSNAGYEPVPGQYMNQVQDFVTGQDYNNGVQQPLSSRSSRSNSLMRPDSYVAVTMGGMPPSMHAYSIAQQSANLYAFNGPVTSTDMGAGSGTRTATSNGMTQQHMTWGGNYQAPAGESFIYQQSAQAGNDREVKAEPEMMGGEGGNATPSLYNQMYSAGERGGDS